MMPNAKLMQIMESIISKTRDYFDREFHIKMIGVDSGVGGLDTLVLKDITAIIGMGGAVNLLIAMSFDKGMINALFDRMTADINIQPDEIVKFRKATAGEVVNTILGHCTGDLQGLDRLGITMTPPVIIDEAKNIHRSKDAMFYTQSMHTEFGHVDINLVGPRELFNIYLEYVK